MVLTVGESTAPPFLNIDIHLNVVQAENIYGLYLVHVKKMF